MARFPLTPETLDLIAHRFKALGDPTRLRILDALRGGEASVSALVAATGLSQANASKQLKQLHALGFVARRKDGLFVRYRLADRGIFRLCDLMCARVAEEATRRTRTLATGATRTPATRTPSSRRQGASAAASRPPRTRRRASSPTGAATSRAAGAG